MNIKQLKELLEEYPEELPVLVCNGDIESIKRAINVIYIEGESGNRYLLINTSRDTFSHLIYGDAS